VNISSTRRPLASRGARATAALALATAATLGLVSCASGAADTAATTEAATKDSIVVAVPALAPTLDGVVGGNGTTLEAFEMNANLQAGLVRNPYVEGLTPTTVVQDFNEYVPYVAESYEVSDDGLRYTFTLPSDLVSQVGNPITADDVIWSFQRKWASAAFPKGPFAAGFEGPETGLVKVDDLTVEFTITDAGFGLTFLGLLANLFGHIYDSTLLQEHATPEDPWALEWAKTNSGWGLGPYMVESQTPDQEMVLTANPNYVYGEPELKTVTLRVVPDAGTRASLVATGDVDIAEGIRSSDQARLESNADLIVPEADPIEYVDLTPVTNKAPFDDEAVRQALAYAIPYDEIIEQIYSGRAVPMVGNINPNTANYSVDGLPTYSYDPEMALEILEEAGYADGVDFTLTVSTATPDLIDASVMIKSYAEDAGFNITIDQQQAAAFGQIRTEATGQAIIYRNRSQVQTPTYASTLFFRPDSNTNPSRWADASNTAYWEVVNQALALPDPLSEEAGALWEEAQTILLESSPEMFLAAIQPSQVLRNTVEGFTYRSENAIDFGNLTARE
jgi:peptide/nickel transport system substrate-binding protein